MELQGKTTSAGGQIATGIWLLAGWAITGGILILALVTGHLLRCEETTSTVRSQQRQLGTIATRINKPIVTLEQAHASLFQYRDIAATTRPREINWSPGDTGIRDLPPPVRSQLESLEEELAAAAEELEEGSRWRSRLARVVAARRAAKHRAETALRDLNNRVTHLSVTSAQLGTTRRQLEDALHEVDKQIILIAEERGERRLRKIGQQMANTLGFLQGALDNAWGTSGESVGIELGRALRSLQVALLGPSNPSNPEVVRSGFLESHRTWMESHAVGDALAQSLGARITRLRALRGRLDQLMGKSLAEAHDSVQARVHALWITCLCIAAIVGAIFFLLVTSVVRRAKGQILDLTESEREASETAQAQARFLASMSHEIRTPMNGVLGMADLLEGSSGLSEENKRLAHTIRSSAESLLTVINDVLDFSKIQAGKLELEAADFDLRDVFAASLDLLRGLATDRGNELRHHIEPDVPRFLRGDPDRLRQILLNLTGNAIKFTQDGEVELRVELANSHRDIIKLHVTVRDTGVGMNEQALSGLFRAFSQVGTPTAQRGGTGLGLTISKRLVQLMGGDISVQSQAGVGSVFSFTVTLQRAHCQTPADFSGHNVLIVSDREFSREQLILRLVPWKLGLDVAESTEQALTQLNDVGPFDLCLVDLDAADSIDLASRIVAHETLATSTHCVVLSNERAPSANVAGVEAWLTKPVHEDALAHCLQSLLGPSDTDSDSDDEPAKETPLNCRILVAEDNAINQRVLKEILRRLGCTPEFADNGLEAIDRIREADYDIVLMDCQMPEMDGFEATRQIRALPDKHALPIIALTANVLPDDRRACKEAGMNDFLSKPIKKDQLREALVRWAPGAVEPG